jgi:hypothetical protein
MVVGFHDLAYSLTWLGKYSRKSSKEPSSERVYEKVGLWATTFIYCTQSSKLHC